MFVTLSTPPSPFSYGSKSDKSDDIDDHDDDENENDTNSNGNGNDNMIYHTLPFALTISYYLLAIIQADDSYNHVLEFRSQQTCLAMTIVT